MSDYECWFCGTAIERADLGAVKIAVESLWRWADSTLSDEDPQQIIFAHSRCAKERMAGARMDLEPEVFSEPGGEARGKDAGRVS